MKEFKIKEIGAVVGIENETEEDDKNYFKNFKRGKLDYEMIIVDPPDNKADKE